MKKLIIGLCMILIFLTACSSESQKKPKTQTEIVCDNQDIWDNRGRIKNFECECDNDDCWTFPVTRRCIAGLWVLEGNKTKYIAENIVCVEVKKRNTPECYISIETECMSEYDYHQTYKLTFDETLTECCQEPHYVLQGLQQDMFQYLEQRCEVLK